MPATSIPSILQSFTTLWSPRLIATVNDQDIKLAKLDGPFIFHAHPDSDELFYVLSGELTLEIEGADSVQMTAGDVYVVKRGVSHRPVARRAEVLIVERMGTVNTGDQPVSERTRVPEDVRGPGT
jgi:mannose-6-phosphate isomerase-like protein (cupin superfamily)